MDRAFHIDMSRDQIIATLRDHTPELHKLGVTAMSVFGSRARGDHRPDSDLDLLIDYDASRKFSLVDLVHVEHFVQDLVGCPVQVTTRSSIPAADRPRIEREAVAVL